MYFLFICILEVDNMKICEMLDVGYMANTWYSSTLCSIVYRRYRIQNEENKNLRILQKGASNQKRTNERVVDHTKTQFHDEFKV